MIIGKQLLKESNVEITVVGKGKNIKEATQNIFKKIHRQVYSEIDYPIVQMETVAVYFDEVTTDNKKTVLSAKETSVITVTSRVELCVKYLDIEEESI